MDTTPLKAGQDFGPYTILRLLGRGGMGAVWLAMEPSLNREVALKVMAPAIKDDPEFVARFRREGLVAARLNHPHIVSVYDIGEAEGAMYLCLEYVPGEPLNVLLKRERRVSPERAVQWGAEIADALAFAHRAGVLHRDVKPSNVLIDTSGQARLMDFGLAKNIDGTALTTTGVLGTPFYMAPELGDGDEASPLTDQYSLGVMLYELLAGRVPFWGESALSVLYQHMHGTMTPLSEVNPEVPLKIEGIIHRMMSRAPQNRFTDCSAAARALETAGMRRRAAATAPHQPADAETADRAPAGAPPGVPRPEPGERSTKPGRKPLGGLRDFVVRARLRRGGSAIPGTPAADAARRYRLPLAAALACVVALTMYQMGRGRRTPTPAPHDVPTAGGPSTVVPAPVEPLGSTPPAAPADAPPATPAEPPLRPLSALDLAPPWEEAPFSVLRQRGGFEEDFTSDKVALRPLLLSGLPRVTRLLGTADVEGDAETHWRGRSLRAVRLSRCELLMSVESPEGTTAAGGGAGLFLDPHDDAAGFEVLVDGTGLVRLLVLASEGEPTELTRLQVPNAGVGTPITLTLMAGPRGVRVQANETIVRGWEEQLSAYGYVGPVVRGPVHAQFDRIVVRTSGL